jgi:hypothetical protein
MNKFFKGYIWVSVLLSSVSLNTFASNDSMNHQGDNT